MVSCLKGGLQIWESFAVDAQPAEMPLSLKGCDQPLPIPGRVAQRGRLHFNVHLANCRIDLDYPVRGSLGDDLFASLALLGDQDQQVAEHLGCAGQATTVQRMFLAVGDLSGWG